MAGMFAVAMGRATCLVLVLATTMCSSQFVANATADEWAYATAVGATVRMGWSTIDGLVMGGHKYLGMTLAPTVGKLFAAPGSAQSVLIVDPTTGAIDNTTLSGLAVGNDKWAGVAFAPIVGKLFAAPFTSSDVLVVDPSTNATGLVAVIPGGPATNNYLWAGIAFAPVVSKLFAAPHTATAVLIMDPVTNVTDVTALGGFGGWW
jgi:hypothetical protein